MGVVGGRGSAVTAGGAEGAVCGEGAAGADGAVCANITVCADGAVCATIAAVCAGALSALWHAIKNSYKIIVFQKMIASEV